MEKRRKEGLERRKIRGFGMHCLSAVLVIIRVHYLMGFDSQIYNIFYLISFSVFQKF